MRESNIAPTYIQFTYEARLQYIMLFVLYEFLEICKYNA